MPKQPFMHRVKSDAVQKTAEFLAGKNYDFWAGVLAADDNLEFLGAIAEIMVQSGKLKGKDFSEGFFKGAVLVYASLRAAAEEDYLRRNPDVMQPKAKA